VNDVRRPQPKKITNLLKPQQGGSTGQNIPPQQQAESILGSLELPNYQPVSPLKKRKLINFIAGTVLVGILLSMVAAAFAYFWYQNALKAKSSEYNQIEVQIPAGASVADSADILEKSGVVKSGLATQLYMTFTGKTSVKAGHYLLSPTQQASEIVNWLNDGRVDTLEVTILPGKTVTELKQQFLQYGYSQPEIDQAFAKNYPYAIFADKPAGTSLEGYIYPDTYFAEAHDSVEDILSRTFEEFDDLAKQKDIKNKLAAEGLNMYQGITLASIVYKEVNSFEDRRIVAQVFLKRLAEGMVLGSDVTFIYGAKLLGLPENPLIDSPYNTRIHKGLPPGPISNFNISALEAVVNSANTQYLYFVAGDDGITRFAFTNEEHEQNVQLYCRKLCGLE